MRPVTDLQRTVAPFEVISEYTPSGDQPKAIKELTARIQAGEKDVVLLERDRLTSGTTWHAAGLIVTFGSTSETPTEMRKYTRDLYARLEAETGLATGFKPVGFIELAADEGRLEEYRRVQWGVGVR